MNVVTIQLLAGGLQVLGGLPLVAYPAVLIANAMQLAARRAEGERRDAGTMAFVAGTTACPLVWLLCRMGAARTLARGASGPGLAWSGAPLAFGAALWALFALLLRAERRGR